MLKKRIVPALILILLLLCTSCWETAFWKSDDTVNFTSTLTSVEVKRQMGIGEAYLYVKFSNGESYDIRTGHVGELQVGVTYEIELHRSYKLWSIVAIKEVS